MHKGLRSLNLLLQIIVEEHNVSVNAVALLLLSQSSSRASNRLNYTNIPSTAQYTRPNHQQGEPIRRNKISRCNRHAKPTKSRLFAKRVLSDPKAVPGP